MLVVLDANIWIEESLLRSPLSASLLYALQNTDSKIVLTDTVSQEVKKGIIARGKSAVQKINEGFEKVQILVGEKPKIPLPTEKDFAQSVESRFSELEDLIHPIEHTEEHLHSALDRVIKELPPSANKEQFRDALVWEATIELAAQDTVMLISSDRDFYQNRGTPSRGLARELKAEVEAINGDVSLFPNIGSFLKAIEQDFDYPALNQLASLIHEAGSDRLNKQADESDFRIGEMQDYEIEAYLTENKDRLAIDFSLEYEAFEVPYQNGTETLPEATLLAEGSCMLNLKDESVSDIRWDRITCIDEEGNTIPGTRVFFMRAQGAVIGIRKIPHRIRRKI